MRDASSGEARFADEAFRPRGARSIPTVRDALAPFGLARDDAEAWEALAPHFAAIAHRFNYLTVKGSVPRPAQVERSLARIETSQRRLTDAVDAFAAAIGELDEVALEWLLAREDSTPLFARGRPDVDGPASAPESYKRLAERTFSGEWKGYDRLAAELTRRDEAILQPRRRARQAAASELAAVRAAFRRVAPASRTRRSAELRAIELNVRALRLAQLRLSASTPPALCLLRNRLDDRMRADLKRAIGRSGAIGGLARDARRRFAAARPIDKGGPSPFFLGRPPRQRMAEECAALIAHAFGRAGFERITSTKHGAFAELLRAVLEYSTGNACQGDEFSEPLKAVARWRKAFSQNAPRRATTSVARRSLAVGSRQPPLSTG